MTLEPMTGYLEVILLFKFINVKWADGSLERGLMIESGEERKDRVAMRAKMRSILLRIFREDERRSGVSMAGA